MVRHQVDGLAVVALAFLAFMVFNVVQDQLGSSITIDLSSGPLTQSAAAVLPSAPIVEQSVFAPQKLTQAELEAVAAPYEHYAVTQGPHGASYGHLAIDLSAGKGAAVLSPINGWVTQLFVDEFGNTTLIIENDRYQVMLLHGIYSVSEGDFVTLGQPVGQESNQGNTVDALGNSCRGRDCGYHSHINIFDKVLMMNVNPLDLWQSNVIPVK